MADNIIDFNQHKQKKQSAARAENTLSLESLMERLSTLPDNGLMVSIVDAVNDRISRLLFLTELGRQVTRMIQSAGFDPDDFALEENSLDRYLLGELDWAEDSVWNGPFFDWDEDDFTVRLATTIRLNGEPTEDSMPLQIMMHLLKLEDGDKNWQRLTDEGWVKDGPPADYFDQMELFPEDWDDEEDDEWEDNDSVFGLNINLSVWLALKKAGVTSIEALSGMTDEAILAIKGIGPKRLEEIRRALAEIQQDRD